MVQDTYPMPKLTIHEYRKSIPRKGSDLRKNGHWWTFERKKNKKRVMLYMTCSQENCQLIVVTEENYANDYSKAYTGGPEGGFAGTGCLRCPCSPLTGQSFYLTPWPISNIPKAKPKAN